MFLMKTFFLFVFLLSLSLNESIDWCEIVKPKGVYNGLGIYYRLMNSTHGRHLMFNREGTEWEFRITFEDSVQKIELMNDIITTNRSVVNKFSLLRNKIDSNSVVFDCEVSVNNNSKNSTKKFITQCTQHTELLIGMKTSADYKINAGTLMIRPLPIVNNYHTILALNKYNITDKRLYLIQDKSLVSKECSLCLTYLPKEMDNSLVEQIDGIADFSIDGHNGYVILFNIENRPKLCFFLIDNLNETAVQCMSSQNMRTLFDECFQTDSTLLIVGIILIIFIIIIVLIIIFLIGFAYYCKKREENVKKVPKRTENTRRKQMKSNKKGAKIGQLDSDLEIDIFVDQMSTETIQTSLSQESNRSIDVKQKVKSPKITPKTSNIKQQKL